MRHALRCTLLLVMSAFPTAWGHAEDAPRAQAVLPHIILFAPASTHLDEAQQARLVPVRDFLARAPDARLTLKSYAAYEEGANGFQARALALERALVVRARLTGQPVEAQRIILHPIAVAGKQADRVEIALLYPPRLEDKGA